MRPTKLCRRNCRTPIAERRPVEVAREARRKEPVLETNSVDAVALLAADCVANQRFPAAIQNGADQFLRDGSRGCSTEPKLLSASSSWRK